MVAGKGGVGKTTVTAVIARAASSAGQRVLVVELDGKPTLAELVPDLEVLAIAAPEALDEYLREHGFEEGVSTRLLIYTAQLVVGGIAPRRACDVAISRAVSDEAQVQEAVAAIIDVILP